MDGRVSFGMCNEYLACSDVAFYRVFISKVIFLVQRESVYFFSVVDCISYYSFIYVVSSEIPDKMERLHALKDILRAFPPVNFEVLKYIISHLNR